MALFQKSVLNKYLKIQNKTAVAKAYKKFTKYFHNPTIQQNIREIKEEGFQQKFLMELFVTVFDYVINPDPNYNLTTEFKNEKGAKKADGAILVENKALTVIELKGTKTKDLESIRQQAFDYKANQTACVYVITSNFEKLRFYINNAVEFEEFNLFTLTSSQFELLYLCLYHENLLNNIPQKIKEASIVEEEKITKKFYADYSLFKRELFRDLVKKNLKNEVFRNELDKEDTERAHKNIKLTLFKKSQKLIDRFLFIFFAEDRGLLPPNSTLKILEQWDELKDLDAYTTLYDRYRLYFDYLDTGRKRTDKRAEIFAYNGGLFKPDTVINSLLISDNLLYKYTKTLANYDFESQVDVNILGHIFENSLNEIESVNAEIEGTQFDKQKTKRKKDGVFYTPKYITKYIVDNTIGKLCSEKKEELNILEKDFHPKRQKETKKKLLAVLENYRDWLLEITILDPACGSGAFLNQALDFLIKEHEYIDELQTNLLGGGFVFPNIENTVLENNIFGVDLNEESVEIAKLSLWLRTAQPRRKLNDLNNNIKCGNSLIDNKAVARDKAFHWQDEFPEIFAKGGFDVVIGNPPYVRQELLGDFKPFFEKNFTVYEGTSDLFAYFYEKSFILLKKKKGVFGFISNTFDKTKAGKKLREFLSVQVSFEKYIDFTEIQVFEGATTYPIILIAKNTPTSKGTFQYVKVSKKFQDKVIDIDLIKPAKVAQNSLNLENWNFYSVESNKVLDKLLKNKTLREQFGKSFRGIVTGFNDAFIIDKSTKLRLEKEHYTSKELIKPFFEGKDQSKWHSYDIDKFIIFTRRGTEIEKFPAIKKYLENNRGKLTPRNSSEIKVGRKPGPYKWFEIQDSVDYYKVFESPKITWPNLQSANKFSLDTNGYYINAPSVVFPIANKSLLCILNSKITWFFLKSVCVVRSGGYIEVKPQYFEQIPIPKLKNEKLFEQKADDIIENTTKMQSVQAKFKNYLQSQFSIEKLSKKLQNWHDLDFGEFIIELNKAIKKAGGEKLTKMDEMDWMDIFETKKAEAETLKAEIDRIDKEIDAMVYELYGLSEEEIKIVESN
jgi:type I restriction-modification system DNA methylase subunit